jgi:ribose transport system permease protein
VVTAESLTAGGSDPLAVAGAIGVGLVVGLINGLLITVVRVNPLITSLAMLSIVRGIAYVWTDALTQVFPGSNLRQLGTGRVLWDIPVSVLIMLAVFVAVWLTLRFTTFGRSLFAVGGNPRAALLAGIDVSRVQLVAYVISGLSAGFAGAILAAQLSAGSPQAANGLELNAVAAVVLGGASLSGGRGRVWGTLLGALIMETLRNGLVLTDVSSFYQMIAWGAVLLLAVVIDQLRRGEASLEEGNVVQRVAFRLRVRPERLAEYKQLHQEVWPELLDDMRAASIRNYSIFADGPELFGYLECDDWEAASEALARSDANRRWQELMSDYLATPVDPDAPEPLRMMEEVFRMD